MQETTNTLIYVWNPFNLTTLWTAIYKLPGHSYIVHHEYWSRSAVKSVLTAENNSLCVLVTPWDSPFRKCAGNCLLYEVLLRSLCYWLTLITSITNSMEQSPSWEDDSLPAFYITRSFITVFTRTPTPTWYCPGQLESSLHTLTSYLFKILFNIILPHPLNLIIQTVLCSNLLHVAWHEWQKGLQELVCQPLERCGIQVLVRYSSRSAFDPGRCL